jgi:hypothetical protein
MTKNVKTEYISFYVELNMFPCMNFFLRILPTFGAINSKPSE